MKVISVNVGLPREVSVNGQRALIFEVESIANGRTNGASKLKKG